MGKIEPDSRSLNRRARDEAIAAEPHPAPLDLPPDATSSAVEAHLKQPKRHILTRGRMLLLVWSVIMLAGLMLLPDSEVTWGVTDLVSFSLITLASATSAISGIGWWRKWKWVEKWS